MKNFEIIDVCASTQVQAAQARLQMMTLPPIPDRLLVNL